MMGGDSSSSGRKRKYNHDEESCQPTTSKKEKKIKTEKSAPSEKRLRRFRPHPPQPFADIYDRATSQRFYVLSRTPGGTADCPEETVELTGSTGNIYTVEIAQRPTCDCPHSLKGNQCKHVVYVLARVLRAKFGYTYQLALLSTELQDIFARAPAAPAAPAAADDADSKSNNRKPVDGDCPICLSEMEPEGGGGEAVVWCRAACGQNIHKHCFEMWATTKRQQGAEAKVTCPSCRSLWEGDQDMVKEINKAQGRISEGYVNVADQVGVSPHREFSYYSRWFRDSR
ncbi:SWIM zinc finger protein [Cercophora scortea]|uniref:SWIM zinc finger protein n=1 Tax=Cercophora scortea TaxID=314031 RepID=A0AAE0J4Y9_9PEZI|nr:SWIM zinc finger protein [Cercophora scortea]